MNEQQMTPLAGEPLPVEFRHGGEWHAAVLLGWRHAPDGGCSMRLRFVVGGLRRSSWLPLADVRLPEPEPARLTGAPLPASPLVTRPDLPLADGERPPPRPPLIPVPDPRPSGGERSCVWTRSSGTAPRVSS